MHRGHHRKLPERTRSFDGQATKPGAEALPDAGRRRGVATAQVGVLGVCREPKIIFPFGSQSQRRQRLAHRSRLEPGGMSAIFMGGQDGFVNVGKRLGDAGQVAVKIERQFHPA